MANPNDTRICAPSKPEKVALWLFTTSGNYKYILSGSYEDAGKSSMMVAQNYDKRLPWKGGTNAFRYYRCDER